MRHRGRKKDANDCEGLGSDRSPSSALGSVWPRCQGAGNWWAKAQGSICTRTRRRGRGEALLDPVPPLSVPAVPTRQNSQGSPRTGFGAWAVAGLQLLPPGTYARGGEARRHAPPAPPAP